MRINTSSVAERNLVLAVAFYCGASWHGQKNGEPTTPEESEVKYPQKTYPVTNVDLHSGYISGGYSGGESSPAQFFAAAVQFVNAPKPPPPVKVGQDYVAELTPTGIKVGCQDITKEQLQAVNKLVFGKEA